MLREKGLQQLCLVGIVINYDSYTVTLYVHITYTACEQQIHYLVMYYKNCTDCQGSG